MDDLSGRQLKGYELRECIGRGGFGAVYRAYQPAVGREVAIKIILPQFANQPDFIRRFETEARLVARLEHIHIVPLYDYWREPSGAYLVMRWLKGGSLSEAIAEGGAFELETAARIVDQIAAALTVAHRHGVVHRDMKPGNILLDEDGNSYLADFGIAKVRGEGDEEDTIAGSPAYIPPEQIMSKPVTPQSDIYSLGVVMYEMLTGKQPFAEPTASALIFKHLQERLPDLSKVHSGLPPAINLVIQRATEKDPIYRYPDALELAADFHRSISGEGTEIEIYDVDVAELVNPYKGLRAFEEADAADFFGREALVEQLIGRIAEDTPTSRFLAVVGPSGSGKSSVVKAGVLPELRTGRLPGSEGWYVAEMSPGVHPMTEIEAALLSVAIVPPKNLKSQLRSDTKGLLQAVEQVLQPGEQMLLIIDQFEELFTLVSHEEERAHFLESLRLAVSAPNSRLRIIITLRADFYDKPLLYEGFAQIMRQRTEVVVPMTSEELERAIVRPAEGVGLEVETELLASIVSDVSEEPGTLPLLQYALTEVFERRDGRVLTLEAYRASGGALGALARRAEELYEDMDSDRQALIRQIFLRLVTVGEGTEDSRRRVGWAELTSFAGEGPDLQAVLDTFGKYRLFSFDRDPVSREPTVEIAHEALINKWGRLREWLSSSREDVRLQRRLAVGATEWRASSRDMSFLLRGALLEQLEDWAATTDLALTEEERGYLAASIVERRTQETREKARRKRQAEQERRIRNRLQVLVAVLAVSAGIALGITAFAFDRAYRLENELATATAAQGAALLEVADAQTQMFIADSNAGTAIAAELDAMEQANAEAEQSSIANATAVAAHEQLLQADSETAELRSLLLAARASIALDEGEHDLALALALEAASIPNAPEEARRILEEVAEIPQDEAETLSLDELTAWIYANHEVRALTCEERELYRVEPMCDS